MKSFKELCLEKMKAKKITRSKLADDLGFKRQAMSRAFRNQDTIFHKDIKMKIANFLDFDFNEWEQYINVPYDTKYLGSMLLTMRLGNEKSQTQVCKDLNITNCMLSYVEAGKNNPSKKLRIKLFEYYGITDDNTWDKYIRVL